MHSKLLLGPWERRHLFPTASTVFACLRAGVDLFQYIPSVNVRIMNIYKLYIWDIGGVFFVEVVYIRWNKTIVDFSLFEHR